MHNQGYYRSPTVHGDTVVFVAEDDLWTVPLTGGTARRLTAGLGSVGRPQLSPDGRWIAFIGKEEGDSEVYVMPSHGGLVKRLTFMGAGTAMVGWHPDGRIIFSTYQGNPFMAWRSLYAVSKDGGEPELLPYGRASWVSFGPKGGVVLGRSTTDTSYWKRYRGGTRGMFWIDRQGNNDFKRFSMEDGNVVLPLWIGDRIYFIADHEDHANLYSMSPSGEDIQRHTDHEDYYVRSLSTDGQTIVYQAGGDLYAFDIKTGQTRVIPVEFYSQRTQRQIKHLEAAEYWDEYELTEHGDELLVTSRGKLYQMAPFEGAVRQLGTVQGVRYRLAQYVDDHTLLVVSDEAGEDRLELRRLEKGGEHVTRIPTDFGIVTEMLASPDGQFAAIATERQQLWLLDLKTFDVSLVAQTAHDRIPGIDWSPDSRWLAYALPGNLTTALYLYELATKTAHQITQPVLADRQPVFDPDGKYLYFLSKRVFKPVWDNMKFDLGFPKGEVPCLIVLSKDTTSPFIPEPRPLVPHEVGGKSEEDKGTESKIVAIDLDGIQDRVLEFPVEEGLYFQLAAGHGQVFWTKTEPVGSDHDDFFDSGPSARAHLIKYQWDGLKEETLADKMTSFALSKDRKTMAVRIRSQLKLVKAGDKLESKDDKPGRESGIVDLGRIHVTVDQLAEWYQIHREAWRWMREMFWVEDMAGVPWDAVYDRYRRLIDRISTRSDLSDVIWEMYGELGSSHAYEYGGQYRDEPHHRSAFLGARYQWSQTQAGYQVTHIIHGDNANPARTSPLLSPGVNVNVGDVITTINGAPLGPDLPPGARLIDYARQVVSLTVVTPGGEPRTVDVKPIASEVPARYREWVDQNRAYVHEKTGGRVGYVHVPDMSSAGFAEFHRGYLAEHDREGLIIDVRYNGGGIVSPLLLEMLGRKQIAYARTRHGHLQAYPYQSPTGAMVALTNENAGSDGDIFSHNFKQMKLGPLIGTRTWGGVIGINPRYHLVDWGGTSQPEDAFWFKDVGLAVENYGTNPDIWVDETPQGLAQGIDEQLDRGIVEIEAILKDFSPLTPDFSNPPVRAPKPLSKR